MTRREMLAAFTAAFALVAAGLTWLFGPYGLIASGLGCALVLMFAVQRVEEQQRGDSVPDAVPPAPGRGFAQHL